MRLLDRYLLRELLIPLGYCLGGFLLFWVAFDLFAELGQFESKGLTGVEIAHYYVLVIPEFLVLILPIALLLALLYSLTNHARHHEITAIRAAGVSLWRLSLPYFAVGLFMSLAAFAVNEFWAPSSGDAADEIRSGEAGRGGKSAVRRVRNLGFTNARDGRHWLIGSYDPETGEMIKPKVFWAEPDGSRLRLEADFGFYTNQTWTFSNAVEYLEAAGTNALPMPVLHTNVLAMPGFSETPELVQSEIKVSKSMGLRSKRSDLGISELLNYLRLHPQPPRADGWWLRTRLQGRFAAPWTCLVVVLIALPFGAASGRRNVFVGVASSIVIAFSYFVLQQVCLALGTGGYVAPWLAAWLPNICFGITGLWLSARVR